MIELKRIQRDDLRRLYDIEYSSKMPKWKEYDAPYFDDFEFKTYDKFITSKEIEFFLGERVKGIYFNDSLIGIVSKYWENEKTRWIEIGIVIFDENFWSKGIGSKALLLWIDEIFNTEENLEHIGLTTWSGNLGMMKCSLKIGMILEGRIRKVRYHNNIFYDSMKYGILKDEWAKQVKN